MHGVAYTVFEGVKPEPMDVEILGVLRRYGRPEVRRHPGAPARQEGRVHRRGRGHERQPGLHRRQAGGRHRLSHRRVLQGADRRHHSRRLHAGDRRHGQDAAPNMARRAGREAQQKPARRPARACRRATSAAAGYRQSAEAHRDAAGLHRIQRGDAALLRQRFCLRRRGAGDGRRLGEQRQAAGAAASRARPSAPSWCAAT